MSDCKHDWYSRYLPNERTCRLCSQAQVWIWGWVNRAPAKSGKSYPATEEA